MGITRQNYYARRQARQRRVVEAELVVALVLEERKVQPRLGSPEAAFYAQRRMLDQEGVSLGRDRFVEVLRAKDLLLEPRPAEYPCTTNSHHLSAGVYQPDQGVDGEPTQ